MTNPWYFDALSCPDCGSTLGCSDSGVSCNGCDFTSARVQPLDLKPHRPKPATLVFQRRPPATDILNDMLLDRPPMDYNGPMGGRDSRELVNAMRPFLSPGALVLDLGCGPRDQAPVFDYLKCKYVGIDYGGTTPDILADAHSIPFQPGTFDVVFSYAVLEHLYNPFLAIMEIDRVLKPGGVYCGTVSQGDPFHASFFHHTTWGFVSLIEQSGMEIRRLWGCYDTLIGLARIGRYPRVIRMALRAVNTLNAKVPLLSPRKALHWSEHERKLDELYRAAGICFLVQKPLHRSNGSAAANAESPR